MDYNKYFLIFLICSLFGWIYEYMINGEPKYGLLFKKLNLKVPLMTMYGLVCVILFAINEHYTDTNIIWRVIIYTLICTILECIIGQTSYMLSGTDGWNYPDNFICSCSGYISVYASMVWFIMIFIFVYISDMYNNGLKN